MAEPLTSLVRGALALVKRHHADAYSEVTGSLDGMRIGFVFEDMLVLAAEHGDLHEVKHDGALDIVLRADRPAVRALMEGRTTLAAALCADSIDLVGTPMALARGLRAFEHFIGGLLRIDAAEDLRRALED
jgi:hypothetical protein